MPIPVMFASSFSIGAFHKPELKISDTPAMYAYAILLIGLFAVYHAANGFLSCLLTFSVMFELLAVVFIAMQSYSSHSASGISAKGLVIQAFSIACRLFVTSIMDGYLPMDVTGDFFYQLVDAFSLATVLLLLYRVHVVQSETYEATAEMTSVAPIVFVSIALAVPLHADMNAYPPVDVLWMASLFMGVGAVVPQIWLVMRARGSVDALTVNYAVAMGFSRVCCLMFMWRAAKDFTSTPLIMGINHAPPVIAAACLLNLVFLGFFTFYYMRAVATDVLHACQLDVPRFV